MLTVLLCQSYVSLLSSYSSVPATDGCDGGIVFLGCPSVNACVRPSVRPVSTISYKALRGSSSPKILGALPPSALHHRVHFLHSPKPEKYELHIGLHLKFISSRVANSVMG